MGRCAQAREIEGTPHSKGLGAKACRVSNSESNFEIINPNMKSQFEIATDGRGIREAISMTPQFEITVDGRDITAIIRENLIRLSVKDKIGISADTLDLSLFFDGSFAMPRAGVTLEIKIGYLEQGLWQVGKYIVEETSLSGVPDVLKIRGISMPQSPQAAVDALQGSTDRTWQAYEIEGTTFGSIVSSVCGNAKLTAKVAPELAKIPMPFTAQIGESDAEFLSRITLLRNGIIKYHDKQVIFEIKDSEKLGTVNIDRTECTSYDFTFSERTKVSSVTAKYQDAEAGKVIKYTAGDGKPRKVIRSTYADYETAKNAAESLLKKLKRGTVEMNLSLPTKPGLLAETKINLTGFPDAALNNEYIIEEVNHNYNNGGLTSDISGQQKG